jgi:hypothetical protein
MSGVRDHFLKQFTDFLDEESGEKSLQGIRERQFSRLADEWLELPSVRGSRFVIGFLIKRLEKALEKKQHESACKLAILLLRADDRNANVARLALAQFLSAAEEAQQCILHRELAREVAAWIERARAHLAGNAPDKEEEKPLSEESIGEVSDDLLHTLARLFLAPHAGITPSERVGRLEGPLERLVREYPAARPVRMLKYWEFAGDASKNERREELRHWILLCKPDIEAVLSDSTTAEKYREAAEKFKSQIKDAGI